MISESLMIICLFIQQEFFEHILFYNYLKLKFLKSWFYDKELWIDDLIRKWLQEPQTRKWRIIARMEIIFKMYIKVQVNWC